MQYSVVIPLYNKERHIARAINSVLSQEVSDFELIVVDDGSIDKSVDVVKSFNDKRIIIIQQSNGGVSSARNTGINQANGTYIAFLDADDEWLSGHLTSFNKMINAFPKAGLFSTAYKIIDENKSTIDPLSGKLLFNKEIQKIDYFKESYKGDVLPVHTSAVCIPKAIFNELGGFVVGHHLGEDLDMWGRIALNYDVVLCCVASSLYYKDTDNRSISRVPSGDYPFVIYYNNLDVRNHKSNEIYVNEYVVMQQFILASKLIKSGNSKQARKLLRDICTRVQKIKLFRYYMSSCLPLFFIRFVINLKNHLLHRNCRDPLK